MMRLKRKEKMKKKEKAEKGERKAESEASLVTKATKNFSADKNERLSLAAFEVPITHSLSPTRTLSLSLSLYLPFLHPKTGLHKKSSLRKRARGSSFALEAFLGVFAKNVEFFCPVDKLCPCSEVSFCRD